MGGSSNLLRRLRGKREHSHNHPDYGCLGHKVPVYVPRSGDILMVCQKYARGEHGIQLLDLYSFLEVNLGWVRVPRQEGKFCIVPIRSASGEAQDYLYLPSSEGDKAEEYQECWVVETDWESFGAHRSAGRGLQTLYIAETLH